MRLLEGYAPGTQLPTEPALARSLGVSRATLREALRDLAEKGIITRRQGLGTFYNGPRVAIDSGLQTLASIDALMLRQGLQCRTVDLEITSGVAGRDAQPLGLDRDARVTVVAQTKVADGRPIAYTIDVLPQAVATPDELRRGLTTSVLDFLAQRRDPAPSHAAADVAPIKATTALARRLQVSPATVLMLLEETVYGQGGAAIDYSRSYLVPGFFQFHLVRRILI